MFFLNLLKRKIKLNKSKKINLNNCKIVLHPDVQAKNSS